MSYNKISTKKYSINESMSEEVKKQGGGEASEKEISFLEYLLNRNDYKEIYKKIKAGEPRVYVLSKEGLIDKLKATS